MGVCERCCVCRAPWTAADQPASHPRRGDSMDLDELKNECAVFN